MSEHGYRHSDASAARGRAVTNMVKERVFNERERPSDTCLVADNGPACGAPSVPGYNYCEAHLPPYAKRRLALPKRNAIQPTGHNRNLPVGRKSR